jgi:iron complex outermembrane receptor protein
MSRIDRRLATAALVALAVRTAVAQQAPADDLDTIYVLGAGESRQVQSVSGEQISLLPGGTSPLKALERLPGVNFQSADPFGAYEWSTRISVRGFAQQQLGFTLDGVPLGDMSYGNHNGLHISRAVPTELVGGVELSQGSGALGTASTSNLGGTIQFSSMAPSDAFGVRLEATGGSESTRRVYAQLDTGEFGAGTRVLLSAVDQTAEKWRGAGDQEQRMFSVKALQPIGDATLTGFFNYSDRAEADYQDLSFDIIRRRGRNWDNWFPDYTSAVASANACAAAGFNSQVACDDAYWNASGLREDQLGYVGLNLPFAGGATLDTKVYLHRNEGQGLWGTPYAPTPGGAPLSIRTTEYDIDRSGLIASLGFQLGRHQLSVGGWIEDNDFNQARRFYGEPSSAAPTRSFDQFQTNPVLTQWEYAFNTDTRQFYVQDSFQATDALRLDFGAKAVSVENSANTITGPVKTGSIKADEGFLPQVAALYKVSDESEFFGSAARNLRAFEGSNTGGPFSQSAEVFNATRGSLEPETSTTFELGYRYTTPELFGSLTAYRVDFKDRLLGVTQGVGILGLASVVANVGGVTTNGAELALGWRPTRGLTWFNSLSWNDSTYDENYTNNNVVVPVAGKQVVNAPEFLLRSELSYDTGSYYARFDANYTAKRYYTYTNDNAAPSYALYNATLGYRFIEGGNDTRVLKSLSVQLDVTNLLDKQYIATIGSNGFVNSDPTGSFQTLLTGAPRQVFVALKAKL